MKIINNIKETKFIIVVEGGANIKIVMLLHIIKKGGRIIVETSEHILVDIHISRMYSDVLSCLLDITSRGGVKTSILCFLY